MNAKIRILSLLVAAVMIFGCLPMTAFATGVNAVAECTHADENKDCLCDTCGETYHPNVNGQCTSCGVWNFETSRIDSNETTDVYNVTQNDNTPTDGDYDERTYIDDSTERSYKRGAFLSIGTDPEDSSNKVLKIKSAEIGSAKLSTFTVTPYVENEEGKIYVIEFDVYVEYYNNSAKNLINFYCESNANDSSTKNSTAVYTATVDGAKYFRLGNTNDTKQKISIGQWGKTRYVYDTEAGKYYTYFSTDNGLSWIAALDKNGNPNSVSFTSAVDQMGIHCNVYQMTYDLYIDNLYVYKTDNIEMNMFDGEDLNKQLASAESGDTVKLYSDADYTGNYVTVPAGVTLDLNGHNLTAEGVALFNGASIVDSNVNKGLLNVPQGNISAANATYKMIPFWNGKAYVLSEVSGSSKINALSESSFEVLFRPALQEEASINHVYEFGINGASDNGLYWTIEIDCIKGDAVAQTVSFAVPDENIASVYAKYIENNEICLSLTVNGASDNFDSYNIRFVMDSDSGITYSKVIGTYNPTTSAE